MRRLGSQLGEENSNTRQVGEAGPRRTAPPPPSRAPPRCQGEAAGGGGGRDPFGDRWPRRARDSGVEGGGGGLI